MPYRDPEPKPLTPIPEPKKGWLSTAIFWFVVFNIVLLVIQVVLYVTTMRIGHLATSASLLINIISALISLRSVQITERIWWEREHHIEQRIVMFETQIERLHLEWPVTSGEERGKEDRSTDQ